MVEGSKDAVRDRFGAGVEFGLHGSGGEVGAYLPGSSEHAGIVGLTGLSECFLRYFAAWFSRFVRMGGAASEE